MDSDRRDFGLARTNVCTGFTRLLAEFVLGSHQLITPRMYTRNRDWTKLNFGRLCPKWARAPLVYWLSFLLSPLTFLLPNPHWIWFPYYCMARFLHARKIESVVTILTGSISRIPLAVDYKIIMKAHLSKHIYTLPVPSPTKGRALQARYKVFSTVRSMETSMLIRLGLVFILHMLFPYRRNIYPYIQNASGKWLGFCNGIGNDALCR